MFTIEVYAAKRSKGGIGLFAGAAAAAGQEIWRFARGFDRLYSEEHLASFDERVRRHVLANGFETPFGWVVGADHDLFMQVCRTPNAIFQRDRLTIALARSVEVGTELTCQPRAMNGADRLPKGSS